MSNLALKLTAQNKKTKAKFLDLGNCGLSEIPAAIRELGWLESLTFSSTWFEDGNVDFELKRSQNTEPANDFSDLTPLAGPRALRTLRISGARIADLSPLANLSALHTLDFQNTAVAGLSPLTGMTALQSLRFWGTSVADLSRLAGAKCCGRCKCRIRRLPSSLRWPP